MSSFLLNNGRSDCNLALNEDGYRNLLWFLHVMEGLMYMLEHPQDSICALSYQRDRTAGILPNNKAFSNIIKNHFQMSVTDFFSIPQEDDLFIAFEGECHKACASLSFPQLKRIYNQMYDLQSYSSL